MAVITLLSRRNQQTKKRLTILIREKNAAKHAKALVKLAWFERIGWGTGGDDMPVAKKKKN